MNPRWALGVLCTTALLLGAMGCTSLSISPGATADGSSYVTYNADDHDQYGYIRYLPRSTNAPGTMRKVYDVDSRQYHGEIPEVAQTYNVVHYANEYGVALGETTFGGLDALSTPYPGSIMDYGSLMQVALQRSKTAREAITTMGQLVSDYGYASTGESMSVADNTEAWIFEIIGKGPKEKGAVWVAMRAPDGHMTGHANQARIRTFPRNDPKNCIYAADVVDFARRNGLYNGTDEAFSFRDIYNPLNPIDARVCEARVWSIFNRVTNGGMAQYLQYARGYDLTNPMPLFVKPTVNITVQDVIDYMRDTYNNTFFEFDFTDTDIGATAYRLPYRPRPLTFNAQGGKTYVNERAIATQQTLAHQVVQIRPGFPSAAIGTIVWFGVDDTLHSVPIPLYAGITAIPTPYAFGVADATVFSFQSAFWVFNMVANLAYGGFSYIHDEVAGEIAAKHSEYFASVKQLDAQLIALWQQNASSALSAATSFSCAKGEALVPYWLQLWTRLFVKYMDFDIRRTVPGNWQPSVDWQAPPQSWYDRVAAATGDHYLMPDSASQNTKDYTKKNTKRRGV